MLDCCFLHIAGGFRHAKTISPRLAMCEFAPLARKKRTLVHPGSEQRGCLGSGWENDVELSCDTLKLEFEFA